MAEIVEGLLSTRRGALKKAWKQKIGGLSRVRWKFGSHPLSTAKKSRNRKIEIKEGDWYVETIWNATTVVQLPIRGSYFMGTVDRETQFHGNTGYQSNEEKHGIWTEDPTQPPGKGKLLCKVLENIRHQQLSWNENPGTNKKLPYKKALWYLAFIKPMLLPHVKGHMNLYHNENHFRASLVAGW